MKNKRGPQGPTQRSRAFVLFLFAVPTLIWGTTWIAVKQQIGIAPVELSIVFRFGLATSICFLLCAGLKIPMRYPARNHIVFCLQGAANYAFNYLLTYHAQKYLPSGVVAVTFTVLIYLNMMGLSFFFDRPIAINVLSGATLGGVGISLLFWGEIQRMHFETAPLWGLALGLSATLCASTGNLLNLRLRHRGVPVMAVLTWGLFYGTLITFAFFLAKGDPWILDVRPVYLFSLAYLAIFGTVIAFASYISLLDYIGPDRAAYSTVIAPIIALLISTYVEDYHWDWRNGLGILLCLLGNILVLRQKAPVGTEVKAA